jgi:hypothetical protein
LDACALGYGVQLIDCDRCENADATAVSALLQTARVSGHVPIVLASVHSPQLVRRFRAAMHERCPKASSTRAAGTRTADALMALGLEASVDDALEAFESHVLALYGTGTDTSATDAAALMEVTRPVATAADAADDAAVDATAADATATAAAADASASAAAELKRAAVSQFTRSLAEERTAESAAWLSWLPVPHLDRTSPSLVPSVCSPPLAPAPCGRSSRSGWTS